MTKKYVVYEEGGLPIVILFSEILNHSYFYHLKPTSAGFFTVGSTGIVDAFGYSVSLDLSSDNERDSHLIQRFLRS